MADPWTVVAVGDEAVKPKPSPYESEDQFRSRMDATYGKGKWRETSGFRSPEHNRAVGGVSDSAHMRGTPEAPGAHDIVIPGMNYNTAAAKLPKDYKPLAEGNHLHITDADPWKVVEAGVAPKPTGDPWRVVAIGPNAAPQGKPKSNENADHRYDATPIEDINARFHRGHVAFDEALHAPPPTGGLFKKKDYANAQLTKLLGGVADMGTAGILFVGDQFFRPTVNAVNDTFKTHINPRDVTDIASLAIPLGGEIAGVAKASRLAREGGAMATDAARAFQTSGETSKAAVKATTRLMNPVGAGARTGMIIRGARGQRQLEADRDAHKLFQMQRAAKGKDAAWHRNLISYIENRSTQARAPDAKAYRVPDTSTAAGRARAKGMARMFDNTEMKQAADKLRDIYQGWRTRAAEAIRSNTGSEPDFIKDYFAHIWKETPDRVQSALGNFTRQGSGRSFIRRSIPTIEDGLKAGLTLKYDNAFEATQHYIDNISRYLTTHDTQGAMKAKGLAGFYRPGNQPNGWTRLNGILTERLPARPGGRRAAAAAEASTAGRAALSGGQKLLTDRGKPEVLGPEIVPESHRIGKHPGTAVDMHMVNVTPKAKGVKLDKGVGDRRVPPREVLYAPPEAAHIYNNWISSSLAQTRIGPLYQVVRSTTNAIKMLQFGLNFAHAGLIGQESVLSELASALGSASRAVKPVAQGRLGEAGARLGEAGAALARTPVAPVRLYRKGAIFSRQLLRGDDTPLTRAFTKAGGQLRMPDYLRTHGSRDSFFLSWRRGSLGHDIKRSAERVFGSNPEGAFDRFKGAGSFVGETIQAATSPLMEHAIPHAKQGAWLSEMENWMRANPAATDEEVNQHAAKVLDSIDNRMGELLQDNIFWHRWIKEVAQIALQSWSFTYGTAREIGGGIKDIPASVKGVGTGKGISPRTAYVGALALWVPTRNAIYQYMKTGKAPQDGEDLAAPQTGGRTPDNQPERAGFLGNEKDLYGYFLNPYGPGEELAAKQTGELHVAEDVAGQKDWRGLPLATPYGMPKRPGVPSNLFEAAANEIANNASPFMLANKPKKGSNISWAERALGIRPASPYLAEPGKSAAQYRGHNYREGKRLIGADTRAARQFPS